MVQWLKTNLAKCIPKRNVDDDADLTAIIILNRSFFNTTHTIKSNSTTSISGSDND